MPTGDFKCKICGNYNCRNQTHYDISPSNFAQVGFSVPGPYYMPSEPRISTGIHEDNIKDVEFLSWGDVGYALFDEVNEMFKMQALINLQPNRVGDSKFVFAKIDKDTSQATSSDGTGEVWEFHISSPVWIFEGIPYYYKTLEEAKEAIRSEAKKFVMAFFKKN